MDATSSLQFVKALEAYSLGRVGKAARYAHTSRSWCDTVEEAEPACPTSGSQSVPWRALTRKESQGRTDPIGCTKLPLMRVGLSFMASARRWTVTCGAYSIHARAWNEILERTWQTFKCWNGNGLRQEFEG